MSFRQFYVSLACVSSLATCFPPRVCADGTAIAAKVFLKFDIPNNTGVSAYDLFITFDNTGNFKGGGEIKPALNSPFTFVTPTIVPAGEPRFNATFGGGIIKAGTSLIGSIDFMSPDNQISVDGGTKTSPLTYWSDINGKPIPSTKPIAISGTTITQGGDITYTITNNFSNSFTVHDLQFLINVPESSAIENALPGTATGFGPFLPDILVPANSSVTLNLPGTIAPGNWLYSQSEVLDANTVSSVQIMGHQAAIPEPTSVILLGAGLIGILGYISYRRLWDRKACGWDRSRIWSQ